MTVTVQANDVTGMPYKGTTMDMPFVVNGENTLHKHDVKTTTPICGSNNSTSEIQSEVATQNGFVWSVVRAYNKHHHLVIRPDDIWIAITTQFGLYVTGNAEKLRSQFVNHKGQKKIIVGASGTLTTADWEMILSQKFVEEIGKSVKDPSVCDWILPDFSTTTLNDRVVGGICLMATLKEYFSYSCILECGIPTITLEGTLEDWEKLHAKVAKLADFGLHEWAAMLHKITSKFVSSHSTKCNNQKDHEMQQNKEDNFWQTICHYHSGGSGPSYLSGWITAFCVFNDKGQWQADNRPSLDKMKKASEFPIIDTDEVPHGYLHVPLQINDNGTEYSSVLFAGHGSYVAIKNNKAKEVEFADTLQPRLSWAMYLTDK